MATQQILVLLFQVRVLVAQLKSEEILPAFFFLHHYLSFYPHPFSPPATLFRISKQKPRLVTHCDNESLSEE